MGSSPDAPEKTAGEVALERRQRIRLNEETAASERRLKGVARGKLGKKSLFAPAFGANNPMPEQDSMLGPTVTEGYAVVDGDTVRAKRKGPRFGRAAQQIGLDKAVAPGAEKKSILGLVGGKSSKKKKLFGGIF